MVLTGAGKVFTVGGDVNDMAGEVKSTDRPDVGEVIRSRFQMGGYRGIRRSVSRANLAQHVEDWRIAVDELFRISD